MFALVGPPASHSPWPPNPSRPACTRPSPALRTFGTSGAALLEAIPRRVSGNGEAVALHCHLHLPWTSLAPLPGAFQAARLRRDGLGARVVRSYKQPRVSCSHQALWMCPWGPNPVHTRLSPSLPEPCGGCPSGRVQCPALRQGCGQLVGVWAAAGLRGPQWVLERPAHPCSHSGGEAEACPGGQ